MRLWQRLTRPALLAVFIAANLASALPLVYCLAPGGHHAVEFAHTASHWGDGQEARNEFPKHNSGAAAAHDCLDVAMVSSADASSRAMDGGRVSHKRTPLPEPASLMSASLPSLCAREHCIFQARPLAPDMALAAHRTVVLLI